MQTITTKDYDVLDQLCYDHYGQTAGVTESVMRANPELLNHGTHLPAGLTVKLPTLTVQSTQQQAAVNLWD